MSTPIRENNSHTTFISPSDVGQSYVRLIIVTAIIAWTFWNESPVSLEGVLSNPMLLSMPGYFVYCIFFLIASYWFEARKDSHPRWLHFKRIFGLLVDLIGCSSYIFLAGEYGLAVYPVFVTIVVGYGLRFGFFYLFLAIGVALLSFSVAAAYSPVLQKLDGLLLGFYIGLILIPGYSALLLKKHQVLLIKLSDVNAARARFIANMSHELRTPLHAIIGNSEVINYGLSERRRVDRSLSNLASSAELVCDAADHLRTLVDSVLDVASYDAGTFVLGEPQEVDLYRLIQSAISIASPASYENSLRMDYFIEPSVPRVVVGWDQHLRAILINIIRNAVKYTESGAVSVYVSRLEISNEISRSIVRFTIKDSGIGFHSSQLKSLFEPFAIGDERRSRRYEGTGLGLTITKQYVDEMGGNIEIESEENVGTVVTIEIPMNHGDEDQRAVGTSRLRITGILTSQDGSNISEWLASGFSESEFLIWNNGTQITSKSDFVPDIVFVESTDDETITAISSFISITYENTIAVLVGRSASLQVMLEGKYVTCVETGNSRHLDNLCSFASNLRVDKNRAEPIDYSILVVDDNETNLQSAEIALGSYGHRVRTVSSASTALETLRTEKFDLIFMDMHMPEINGVEAARAYFAGTTSPAPIVMLTADATKAANVDAAIPAIAGFLTKPIKPSELQQAVLRFAEPESKVSFPVGTAESCRKKPVEPYAFSTENFLELYQAGVDRNSLNKLISKFEEEGCGIVEALKEAAGATNTSALRSLLHKLKGSGGAMHVGGLVHVVDEYQQLDDDTLCSIVDADAALLTRSISSTASSIRYFVNTLS